MRRALALVALLAPAIALAIPPHSVVEVKPGDTTFVRLFEVRALAVVDPSIASVERMPSEELLVTGKKSGTTDVVALAGGKLVGLRVHVRGLGETRAADSSEEKLAAVRKSCANVREVNDELGATPSTPVCRAALFALFATDRYTVKQISVDFDTPALQAQLADMEPALKAANLPVKVRYQGATLLLEGTLTPEQAGKLVVALYTHALGGVPVDDGELNIESPDAGPPPAAKPAAH